MEEVGGVPIGGMEDGVSYLIRVPIGGMEEVEGITEVAVTIKTNPERYHAEYPQSVSARDDTRYESPHSPPVCY